MSDRIRRVQRAWCALVVAVAVILGCVQLARAGREAIRTVVAALPLRHETVASAQERIFGSGYMAAIREVRRQVGEHETILAVERRSGQRGALFLCSYHLAPRSIVRLSSRQVNSPDVISRLSAKGDRWLIVLRGQSLPPELWRLRDFPSSSLRALEIVD